MGKLFETIQIDEEEVRKIVQEHWQVKLGDCLKRSQNHTYVGVKEEKNEQHRFIVRVTPDPANNRYDSMELEVGLLDYLHEHSLPVSSSIPSLITGKNIVQSGTLLITLFRYATGEPLVFTEWRFLTEKPQVVSLGRWIGQFHILSKRFAIEKPELARSAREWTQLHDGVLSEVSVSEVDQKTRSDPNIYGIIHGDINMSNYFWNAELDTPIVFDWDQVQLAWFVYDLTSPIWTVIMLSETGSPIDNSPVPQANVKQYTDWLLEGYEPVNGPVDRDMLQRMINIRKELYLRFCSRAILEIPDDHQMAHFCRYIVNWLTKK